MSMTEQEYSRRSAIEEIQRRHKLPLYWAAGHIDGGSSLEAARGSALEAIGALSGSGVFPIHRLPGDLQLTQRERGQYSITRAILAQCRQHPEMGAAPTGSFEADCSAEIEKRAGTSPAHGGLFIPYDILLDSTRGDSQSILGNMHNTVLQQRVLTASGGVASGGALVQNTVMSSQYITPNYNLPGAIRAGARVLSGLKGNVLIPKMTSGKSGTWVNPENTAVPAVDATFAQVPMTPHDYGTSCDMSRRILLQSTPAIDGIVRDDIMWAINNGVDQAAIAGTGTGGQPLGIMGTAGVTTVAGGTNGSALTWNNVTYLQQKVAEGNRMNGPMAFLTNAQALMHAVRTPKIAPYPVYIAEYDENKDIASLNVGGGFMAGTRVVVSNNVPGNLVKGASGAICSAMIFGNFGDLLIGEFGTVSLLADPFTFSNSGAVRIVAFTSIDIMARYPQSFAMLTDLLTV